MIEVAVTVQMEGPGVGVRLTRCPRMARTRFATLHKVAPECACGARRSSAPPGSARRPSWGEVQVVVALIGGRHSLDLGVGVGAAVVEDQRRRARGLPYGA